MTRRFDFAASGQARRRRSAELPTSGPVAKMQIKRRRLWLNDGSCIRLRPQYKDHVWSYDFIEDATHDGRKLRMLVVIDEFSRECLAVVVARRLQSKHVLECLSDLFVRRGTPAHIRSDCAESAPGVPRPPGGGGAPLASSQCRLGAVCRLRCRGMPRSTRLYRSLERSWRRIPVVS